MKKIILFLILLIPCLSNNYNVNLPKQTIEQTVEQQVFNAYFYMGQLLNQDNLLSISSYDFAIAATVVAYCESELNSKSKKQDQVGIAQFTKSTAKLLNAPDTLIKCSIFEQIALHEQFLRRCSKKALLSIKNSVDFHAVNFAPSRAGRQAYLSSTSNKYLKGLDFDKNNIITKNDLKLFQKIKTKQNKVINNLFILQKNV